MGEGRHAFGSPDGEPKIGAVLESARTEKGLTLEEVEQATKIRKRYLEGLEREDYSMLPDAVYAQGFLKTYANFLGLDGEALSRQVRNRRKPRRERGLNYNAPKGSEFERPLLPPGGVTGTERRKVSKTTIITLVVALLVVAGVLGTLYRVGLNTQRPDGSAPPEPAGDARGGAAGPAGAGGTAEGGRPPSAQTENVARKDAGVAAGDAAGVAAPEALRVEIEVEGAPSWLRVRADGSTVFEGIAQPGFSRAFEGERGVGIKAGNAGAVSAEVNAQDLGSLGEDGEVISRGFTLKDEV